MSMLNKLLNSPGFGFSVLRMKPLVVTATRSIKADVASFIHLNHSSVSIALTLDAPKVGQYLVISQKDSGTASHTVTLTAGTYNGSNTIATFNAQNETLVLFGVSTTRYVIVENIGSVGLS